MEIHSSLIRHSFNRAAPFYDDTALVQQWSAKKLAEKLPAIENQSILDLGCGTGNLTPFIFPSENALYLGIDVSEKMLEKARQKAGVNGRFHFACANIPVFLKTCVKRFDLIISNATMQWLPLKTAFIRNLVNSLKDNGQLLFTYYPPSSFEQLKKVLKDIEKKEIALVCDSFYSGEKIEAAFQVFFEPIAKEHWQYTAHYSSMREMLQSIKKTGISPLSAPKIQLTRNKIERLEVAFRKKYKELAIHYPVEFYWYKRKYSTLKS